MKGFVEGLICGFLSWEFLVIGIGGSVVTGLLISTFVPESSPIITPIGFVLGFIGMQLAIDHGKVF